MNIKICFAFQISSQSHETKTAQRDGTSVDGTKGQLISKWCLKFSKKTTKKLTNFFKRIKALSYDGYGLFNVIYCHRVYMSIPVHANSFLDLTTC